MNPGERLLKTYDALIGQSSEKAMVKIWAQVFSIEATDDLREDAVLHCLMALRSELDFAKQLLVSKYDVDPNLLSPGFPRLREVASPALLHTGWSGVRGNIQPPEHRQAFLWSAWMLRDEAEEEMPEDVMAGLSEQLSALDASLLETEMSEYLRTFITQQMALIRNALRVYGVQGVRAVKDAIKTVAGACAYERERLLKEGAAAPEAAQSVLSKANDLIKNTAEVCDRLDKLKKGAENVASLATVVTPLLAYGAAFLQRM